MTQMNLKNGFYLVYDGNTVVLRHKVISEASEIVINMEDLEIPDVDANTLKEWTDLEI